MKRKNRNNAVLYLDGGWGNPFTKANSADLVSSLAPAVGNAASSLISNGYSSGVGNAMSSLSSIAGAIPGPWGAIASTGLNVLGGTYNALFGTKVDLLALNLANANIQSMLNFQSNASNFDLIQGPLAVSSVGLVYSGGLFNKGNAERKNKELLDKLNFVVALANRNVENNINNLVDLLLSMLQSSYAADGGSINIKPSKRGTFTAAASKHNMGVLEFASKVLANKENYSPAMVKKANFARNASKWHHAFGGDLLTHGANFDDGFTYVDNGGTHELNPNEGVLMGIAPDGKPNLVEEGEVIYNDYVFSNRLKPTELLLKDYGLNSKYKDKTFANIAMKLNKDISERPNDPISKLSRDTMLSRLTSALEDVRLDKESNSKACGGHLKGGFDYTLWLNNSKYDGDIPTNSEIGRLKDSYNLANSGYINPVTIDTSTLPKVNPAERIENSSTKKNNTSLANLLRGMSVVPGIVGLFNPPTAHNINVPRVNGVRATPVGLYMTYTPMDINYLANRLTALANANARNLMNISGGNRGTAMAGLLANNYLSLLALGDAYRLADLANLALKERVLGFNRATDLYNSESALKAAMANLLMEMLLAKNLMYALEYANDLADKVYSARMGNLLNIFGNLSNIGLDILNRLDARYAADALALKVNKENGGKINKRRRGLTY